MTSPTPLTPQQGLWRRVSQAVASAISPAPKPSPAVVKPATSHPSTLPQLDYKIRQGQGPASSTIRRQSRNAPFSTHTLSPPTTKSPASTSALKRKRPSASEDDDSDTSHGLPTRTPGRENAVHTTADNKIRQLLGFRRKLDGSILIQTQWEGGSPSKAETETWEPEEGLQEDVPELLYQFWSTFRDGRPLLRDDDNEPVFFVFKVLRHRVPKDTAKEPELRVQWVGYSPNGSDSTWEPESKIRAIAPEKVDSYWNALGGRDKYTKNGAKRKAFKASPVKRRKVAR